MPQPAVRARRPIRSARVDVEDTAAAVTWDDAVDAFLAAKRSLHLSPSTLTNYDWHLRGPRARTFLRDHDVDEPGQLTAELLQAFQVELLDSHVSTALTHAFNRVWKNFARYCKGRGWGVAQDVLEVKGPKQDQLEPEFFTKDEEKRLMAAARVPRDRMLLEFLVWTGLRLKEVCSVKLSDIIDGPSGSYLRVRQGKGRKDRLVPLDTGGHSLSVRIRRYIREDRPKSPHDELFLTFRRGADGEYGPLTPRGLQILLYRLGQQAGVQRTHPHKFRHTFGSRAIAAGVDPITLARVMGHTSLTMTNKYVHYDVPSLIDKWKARKD